jgi:hypothetical protein
VKGSSLWVGLGAIDQLSSFSCARGNDRSISGVSCGSATAGLGAGIASGRDGDVLVGDSEGSACACAMLSASGGCSASRDSGTCLLASFVISVFPGGVKEKLNSGSSSSEGGVAEAAVVSPAGAGSIFNPKTKMCLQREQRNVGLGVVMRLSETL